LTRTASHTLSRVLRRRRTAAVGSAESLRASIERLRDSGVEITRVVDGGAFRGHWVEVFRQVFPDARALLVEPQSRHADQLRRYAAEAQARTTLVPVLLGASSADAVAFHVLDDQHDGPGSSVMRELSDVAGHTEFVPMRTLRQILEETDFETPEFVKLDVQGYELEVLRGLGDLLGDVDFVLLEVAVIPYNEGAPLMVEVLGWMEDRGFVVHDLAGETRLPDGTLAQVDVLFARSDLAIRKSLKVEFGHT
jgi:FkbM family methyltransferase